MRKKSHLSILCAGLCLLSACSDNDPQPAPSPYPTLQELKEQTQGHLWKHAGFTAITGEGKEVDLILDGMWESTSALKFEGDHIVELQFAPPGKYQSNDHYYTRTSEPYSYDPLTGTLRYTIELGWTCSKYERVWHVESVSDTQILLNNNYGIVPFGYTCEEDYIPDPDYTKRDPDSHYQHKFVPVETAEEQSWYDKYCH